MSEEFEASGRGADLGAEPEGRDGEALLHKCCADLGVNMAVAIQVVAWAEENSVHCPRPNVQSHGRTQEERRFLAHLIDILDYLHKHPDRNHVFAVLYQFDIPRLDDIIGHRNPTQYADAIHQTREAVNKAVTDVREHFQLPRRRGQRDEAARAHMTKARNEQLKKNR